VGRPQDDLRRGRAHRSLAAEVPRRDQVEVQRSRGRHLERRQGRAGVLGVEAAVVVDPVTRRARLAAVDVRRRSLDRAGPAQSGASVDPREDERRTDRPGRLRDPRGVRRAILGVRDTVAVAVDVPGVTLAIPVEIGAVAGRTVVRQRTEVVRADRTVIARVLVRVGAQVGVRRSRVGRVRHAIVVVVGVAGVTLAVDVEVGPVVPRLRIPAFHAPSPSLSGPSFDGVLSGSDPNPSVPIAQSSHESVSASRQMRGFASFESWASDTPSLSSSTSPA
jgi:hypothetical protein